MMYVICCAEMVFMEPVSNSNGGIISFSFERKFNWIHFQKKKKQNHVLLKKNVLANFWTPDHVFSLSQRARCPMMPSILFFCRNWGCLLVSTCVKPGPLAAPSALFLCIVGQTIWQCLRHCKQLFQCVFEWGGGGRFPYFAGKAACWYHGQCCWAVAEPSMALWAVLGVWCPQCSSVVPRTLCAGAVAVTAGVTTSFACYNSLVSAIRSSCCPVMLWGTGAGEESG